MLAKAYHEAWEARRNADEWRDWTMGQYFAIAVGTALSKDVKYPEEPLPVTARKEEEQRRREERLRRIKARALAWASAFNAQRGGASIETD